MIKNKNRNHLQIVSDILDKCIEPQNKTRIMYRSNLNYKMLNDSLSELLKAGLLKASALSETKYVITPKGKKYLEKYRELQEIADLSSHDECSFSLKSAVQGHILLEL